MKFCRQNVYAHMKDVHKMTLAEYEMKVGMGRNGEYDGDDTRTESHEGSGIVEAGGNGVLDDDNDAISADGEEIVLQGEAQTASGFSQHEGMYYRALHSIILSELKLILVINALCISSFYFLSFALYSS